MFPYTKASAQTPPFPQIGQTWTYSITGEADWDDPLDVTIGFSATAKYTVTGVLTGVFTVRQEVSGNPIWPTSAGTGGISYYDWGTGYTSESSNTSFSFITTGTIALDDSEVSSLSGDEYSSVELNWTSGSDTVGAYIGLHQWAWLFAFFPLPYPTLFLADGENSIFYWNTSLAPWDMTENPAAWTNEPVTTALGVRNALRNTTAFSGTIATTSGSTTLDTWIDLDSRILLKLTDTTTIDNDGLFDCTMTTNIDIVSCDFFGILGTLMYTKLAGIPLLFLIIAVIVILVIVLLIVCILTRRKK